MKMKKITTQAFLVLCLLLILLYLSFEVRVAEARRRHLVMVPKTQICTKPPPPCGASPSGSQVTGQMDKSGCKTIPRPPRGYLQCSQQKG
ncbi:hypothetical protein CARUB_v10018319mg [Capsella rubella]|uniref:Uncharacterized protein n=1 Tax=Capsella rubella TaxID=81985 RepID=R0FRX7_9BRAS|nr:hypothetical protein CARUB_v10018319mg [Capsella rubella]